MNASNPKESLILQISIYVQAQKAAVDSRNDLKDPTGTWQH